MLSNTNGPVFDRVGGYDCKRSAVRNQTRAHRKTCLGVCLRVRRKKTRGLGSLSPVCVSVLVDNNKQHRVYFVVYSYYIISTSIFC